MSMPKTTAEFYIPFTKTDEEQRMVFGYCTSEALDSQGEIIKKEAIQRAWEKYMEYANVREMHQPSAVGVTKEYGHDDNGTWIGVKVVDDRAWKFVKEGVYKGFSIGGRVLKKSKNIIEEIILAEISLVDRPANPDAKFSAVKFDSGVVDIMEEDINNQSIAMTNETKKTDEVKVEEAAVEVAAETVADAPAEAVDAAAEATEVVAETPAEETKAEEAPVAPVVEETPAAEEGEKSEAPADLQKAGAEAKKDTVGVITLAELLSHADYMCKVFEMNGKDTTTLRGVCETIKSMIASEAKEEDAVELAAPASDLRKTVGEEFSKAIAPVMEAIGEFRKGYDALVERVAAIENTKVSPRPQGSIAVEKSFESTVGASQGSRELVAKRKELESIAAEIDAFALRAKGELAEDPAKSAALKAEGLSLHKRYRACQEEITALLGQGAQ